MGTKLISNGHYVRDRDKNLILNLHHCSQTPSRKKYCPVVHSFTPIASARANVLLQDEMELTLGITLRSISAIFAC